MSKLRDKLKKVNAGLLAAVVVLSSLHITSPIVEAATPEFDAENVVLRMGVLSDPHFMYTDDDTNLTARVEKFKNAMTYLNNRASNSLDMIMLAGDYTGTGSEVQATAFAKTMQETLDTINEGKEEADETKFIFTYGNHDTEWSGQMDYAGWESVLNQYGLLDDVEKGPEGCYKTSVKVSGGNYYFYSLETYSYNNPTNMFLEKALDWLDEELNSVTTNDPNSYVYVVSHGPIWESGVYGSDFEFDRNATWGTAKSGFSGTASDGSATSSDVHNVLRKYPQVVYFSGHTHRTNILESSIMQKDYTAINVASINGGDLFADGATDFVEGNYDASRPGYALLVEVDGNGNQKITRINIENNSVCGEPWVMSAPNEDNTHLETYTQEARQNTPTFASDAALSIDNIAYTDDKDEMTFDVSFDAASCDGYIFRYELVLYDQNGKSIDTKWMVGNWTDHTTGVAEGTNHFNATKFTYSLSVDNEDLFGATGIYATLCAVDEFGGKSEVLTWKSQDDLQSVALMKPTGSKANKNLLDGFTTDRIATRTDGAVGVADNGDESITFTATGNNGQIVYALNDAYAASTMTTWGLLGSYANKLTTIDPTDTFVYETDFKKTSGGDVFLAFRSPYFSTGAWKSSYTGINLTSSGVTLRLGYDDAGVTSDAFKLTDTETHHIKIVSAPSSVSVWIDDIAVFSDQTYASGDAVMYPAIGMFAVNAATFTVGNQLLYLYNSEDQVADSVASLYKEGTEFYDPDAVGCDRSKFEFSSTENKVTVTSKDGTNNELWFTQRFDDVLSVTDTIITELEYTPTDMTNTDPNVWTAGNIVGIQIRYRADETQGDYASVNLRLNGSQNMFYFADAYHKSMTSEANVQNGQKVKVKIVSDNKKASVWIDDVLLVDNLAYTDVKSDVDTTNMKPFLQVGIRNATWEISNISVRKAAETIPNVTLLTEENNLLESQFVNIKSNLDASSAWSEKPRAIINGTNIYTDMRKTTLVAAGYASNYWYGQEQFSFWGISGNNPKISPNESFVFSTLAKMYNTTAENDGIVSRYRMRIAAYNGVTTGFILDDTSLTIREVDTQIAAIDLASEIGYTVGDEIRVTILVSPFGWDLYIDGYMIYSYKAPAQCTVDYSVLQLSTGGSRARFLDTSVHYNNDNGELYKEKILEQVTSFEGERKGIWYDNKAQADAEVAKVKALCEGLDSTSNEVLKSYVNAIGDIIKSGKVTNNMVWDGTASIGETTSIDLDGTSNTSWSYGSIPINNGSTYVKGDVLVYEADVECVEGWSPTRVGLGLTTQADGDIMIQLSTPYYYGTNGWTPCGNISSTWGTGQKWHVKFIVKPFESVQTVVTNIADGATIWDYTVQWSTLGKVASATSTTVFYPRFYFACGDFNLTNIYAGYDVTDDVASLADAATAAKEVSTTGYTVASVNAFNEAIANAEKIASACTDAFTNPYSKAEINAAEEAIATAKATLMTATAELLIGTQVLGEVAYGVADGDALPTGYVEDKYVFGWTLNDTAITKYDATNDIADYVPEYIDRDMLDVAWQQSTAKDTLFRFIGSVNDTKAYSAVGFEFSLDGETWYDLGKQTTVYEQIKENDSVKKAGDLYGEYSTHVFVQPLDFGSYTEVYVRSYVVMEDDGTVVYGDVSIKDTTSYGQN